MSSLVRLLRRLAGLILFALAGRWALLGLLEYARARARGHAYMHDPVTGLRIRVAPLTRTERRAAGELERELLADRDGTR